MNKPFIHLALADDHTMFRKGLASILSGDNFKILIEANNGGDLIRQLENITILPDICILDIGMPGMNGYETLPVLKEKWPTIKILILSMFEHEYAVVNMLRKGANGYLSKTVDPGILIRAITGIYENGYFHSEESLKYLQSSLRENRHPSFTEKERAFISLCFSELTYSEMADQLGLSARTIEGYRDSIFQKLNVHSRAELMLFAVKTGLVSI